MIAGKKYNCDEMEGLNCYFFIIRFTLFIIVRNVILLLVILCCCHG